MSGYELSSSPVSDAEEFEIKLEEFENRLTFADLIFKFLFIYF